MKLKSVFAVLLAMLLLVSACTPAPEPPPPSPVSPSDPVEPATPETPADPQAEKPSASNVELPKRQMVAASQLPGSLYVTYISAWASVMMDNFEGLQIDQEAGGSSQNVMLVNQKEADFGITTAATAYQGWWGLEWANGVEYQDMRAVCPAYPATLAVFTLSNSGITSMSDLQGKTVSVGPSGNLSNVFLLQCIELFNLQNVKIANMTWADCGDALRDGMIDAVLYMAGHPVGFAQELEVNNEMGVFTFTPEEQATIKAAYPYYVDFVVPADVYTSMKEDLRTITAFNLLFCDSSLPDDFIYALCDVTYNNVDRLVEANPGFATNTLENVGGVTIPYHPGALKYMEDHGVAAPPIPPAPAK